MANEGEDMAEAVWLLVLICTIVVLVNVCLCALAF